MGRAKVNTETAEYTTTGMNHVEGGWPRDIDPTEAEQVNTHTLCTYSTHARTLSLCSSRTNAALASTLSAFGAHAMHMSRSICLQLTHCTHKDWTGLHTIANDMPPH